jgi:hypothetical protein
MGYRNKTYVIFDGDNDIWAYRYMKGWKQKENIDFDFHDAHDLNTITNNSSEDNTKRKLRERFSSAKQVIVLVGDKTKNLYKFVRWEMEVALKLKLPIIAVNLNDLREYDVDLCPPILRDEYVMHVSYKAKIIKYALDEFPLQYNQSNRPEGVNRSYKKSVYDSLGL